MDLKQPSVKSDETIHFFDKAAVRNGQSIQYRLDFPFAQIHWMPGPNDFTAFID